MIDRKTGYTTLLLDMDGTFLDFEAAEKSAFMTAMTRHGYPSGEREYAAYGEINRGLWEAFERGEIDKPTLLSTRFGRLFDALGIKGDGAAFEREYQALLGEGAQLVEGAEEVLSYLADSRTGQEPDADHRGFPDLGYPGRFQRRHRYLLVQPEGKEKAGGLWTDRGEGSTPGF